MLRIITDTASDITPAEAAELGVDLVEIEILFDGVPCPQTSAAYFDLFYEKLAQAEQMPTTSRPSPQQYLDHYEAAKAAGDEVLVLCLSGGLSGTFDSACTAKHMADYDKIEVVDTEQAILTQRMLVERAASLRDAGRTLQEIAEEVRTLRNRVVVCGVVGTLKYLKKGGRIPPALAAIGEALKIKPVIVLEDKILKTIGKARGHAAGAEMLWRRMEQDDFDASLPVYFGHTSNRELVESFAGNTAARYGLSDTRQYPIGGIIGTHCGTDCIAVAYFKK